MTVTNEELRRVEDELQQVYNYCPPTRTHYASDAARDEYKRFWGDFFARLGVPPAEFSGKRVLDAGCGSCEKLSFYHDWGGQATGVDVTAEVLKAGRLALGDRDVELIQSSLFDLDRPGFYDIAIVDGVSFVTADTFRALDAVASQVKPGGKLVFSLTNAWGHFWWFRFARLISGWLGGGDFQARVKWGRRLFLWTRAKQEGTDPKAGFYRSEDSWAYDWFGPPAYHLHSPSEVRGWLRERGLTVIGSVPSIEQKDPPATAAARLVRMLTGDGPSGISLYWLANRAPNMFYVAATRPQ